MRRLKNSEEISISLFIVSRITELLEVSALHTTVLEEEVNRCIRVSDATPSLAD